MTHGIVKAEGRYFSAKKKNIPQRSLQAKQFIYSCIYIKLKKLELICFVFILSCNRNAKAYQSNKKVIEFVQCYYIVQLFFISQYKLTNL